MRNKKATKQYIKGAFKELHLRAKPEVILKTRSLSLELGKSYSVIFEELINKLYMEVFND